MKTPYDANLATTYFIVIRDPAAALGSLGLTVLLFVWAIGVTLALRKRSRRRDGTRSFTKCGTRRSPQLPSQLPRERPMEVA